MNEIDPEQQTQSVQPEITSEQLRALTIADRQQREQAALTEYNAFCKSLYHRFKVRPVAQQVLLNDGVVVAQIIVKAVDE